MIKGAINLYSVTRGNDKRITKGGRGHATHLRVELLSDPCAPLVGDAEGLAAVGDVRAVQDLLE